MTDEQLSTRIIGNIRLLSREKLRRLAAFIEKEITESAELGGIQSDDEPRNRKIQSGDSRRTPKRDWPHAPVHRICEHGTYMVTAGTLSKQHFFRGKDRLDLLQGKLLEIARQYEWRLEAWAVFSNHYHFVAHSPSNAESLKDFLRDFHASTATSVNRLDGTAGRRLWFNYWETQLTYERSYLARLNYVHQNPVKHGLVPAANQYGWCSAAWLESTATPAQVKTICSFKTDRLRVLDDFDVPEE
jgi:putative transposase